VTGHQSRFNYPDDDYEDALTIVKGISENGIGIGAFIRILTDVGNNMSGYVISVM
jgi:hypothetical protein